MSRRLLSPFPLWCLAALLDAFQSFLSNPGQWGQELYWRIYPWHEAMRLYTAAFVFLSPVGFLLVALSLNERDRFGWMGSIWRVCPVVVFLSLSALRLPIGEGVQLAMCGVLAMLLFPVLGLLAPIPPWMDSWRLKRAIWSGVLLCLLLLIGGTSWTCHRKWSARSVHGPFSRPNVVLISLDTLRPDRLGCYGSDRPNSPVIDALAKESVLFERAYAQAPYTLPSHVSLLTSLYPDTHGVLAERTRLSAEVDSLAEILERQGYATAAFVESDPDFFLGASYGLDQGFQYYGHFPDNLSPASGLLMRSFLIAIRERFTSKEWERSHRIASAAASWIRQSRSRPFFLFLHLFAVHAEEKGYPYHPYKVLREDLYPTPLPEQTYRLEGKSGARFLRHLARPTHRDKIERRLLESIVGLYDRGVHYADEQTALVARALRERGIWDQTIVVLTADHGEQFLEAGGFLHDDLHEQVVRIPILLKEARPDPPSLLVNRVVQSVDIAPTVCELAGIPVSEEFQGRSLLPWKKEEEGVALAGYLDNVALWKGPWKLWMKDDSAVWEGTEGKDGLTQSIREEMEALLEEKREDCRRKAKERVQRGSSSDTNRLRELGYLD